MEENLKNKKILICIAFHYNKERLQYLEKVVENFLNYKLNVHIIVDTNKNFKFNHNVEIKVHEDLEHPFLLTWVHRKYIYDNINNYDYFIYSEDDMLIPYDNFINYLEDFNLLYNKGFVPCFIRLEQDNNEYYSTDICETQINRQTVEVNGKTFANLTLSYFAFWIMPKNELQESFKQNRFFSITDGRIREEAASYAIWSLNKIPVILLNKNEINKLTYCYHLPNNYANDKTSPNGKINIKQLIMEKQQEHFYESIEGWSTFEDQGNLLLEVLNHMQNPHLKIAEIGVYKGRGTAMWIIELLNKKIKFEYFAIDHYKGSDEHDNTVDYYAITQENLKDVLNHILLINNDSINESQKYPDEYFDIVYIDASHDYESVKQDIIHWLPKVKTGGVICGDDYIDGWPGVVKAVNEIFAAKIKIIGRQQWYHIK